MLETFKALAEPHRFQIVELLLERPRAVGDLVQELRLNQPQVSKHLRVLTLAGLVHSRVDAQRRIYALQAPPLRELDAWIDRYRCVWEAKFQRLDSLLEEMKTTVEKNHGRRKP